MVSLANVQMTLHYIKDVRVQCVLCCVCAGMSLRARSTVDCVTAAGAVVCSTVCYIRQFDVHSYNPACAAWALPIWDFQASCWALRSPPIGGCFTQTPLRMWGRVRMSPLTGTLIHDRLCQEHTAGWFVESLTFSSGQLCLQTVTESTRNPVMN